MSAAACLLQRMYRRRVQDHVAEVKPHPIWRSCFCHTQVRWERSPFSLAEWTAKMCQYDVRWQATVKACDGCQWYYWFQCQGGIAKWTRVIMLVISFVCSTMKPFKSFSFTPFKWARMRPPYTHVGMHWHPLMEDPANTYADCWAWESMVADCYVTYVWIYHQI